MVEWLGTERWHGTNNGYTNYKCRCDRCKEARSVWDRARRMNGRASLERRADRDGAGQTLDHGKEWLYKTGRCACEKCKGAATAARRRRREAAIEQGRMDRPIDTTDPEVSQWDGVDGAF